VSIFSKIIKGIGKVAKAGLSVATHGVSDKVLSVAKTLGIGTKKAKVVRPQALMAQVEKIGQMKPSARITSYTDISDAPIIIRRKKPAARRATRPTRARSAPRTPVSRASARARVSTGAKRSAPKGGLDLKRISAMWASAGKPGKWIDFIKANSHVRKA